MNEDWIEYLSSLAFCYLRYGRSKEAMTLFDLLHRLCPSKIAFRLGLAKASLDQGNAQQCLDILNQVRHQDPREQTHSIWKCLWQRAEATLAKEEQKSATLAKEEQKSHTTIMETGFQW